MAITLNGSTGISTPAVTNSGAYTGDGVVFADGTPSNTLVTTTGGSVGVGVTPSAWNTSFGIKALDISGGSVYAATNDINVVYNGFFNSSSQWIYKTTAAASRYTQVGSEHRFYTAPSGTAGNAITFTQAMTLDSSGNLIVGGTDANTGIACLTFDGSAKYGLILNNTSSIGTGQFVTRFKQNGNFVGSIQTTASATAYVTSSDYRLKDITGELTGYKERVMALQPKQGSWKVDGSEFRGFLAHEFANQYPSLVSGEKDAIDKDGNPEYQGMQAGGSETIADLVALAQEQQAIIQSQADTISAMEARLTALENK